MGMGLISGLVSGLGSMMSASAQASAMDRQAAREEEAARVEAATIDRDTKAKRREVDEVQGNLRAQAAASGLSLDSADTTYLAGDIAQKGGYEVRKSQWNATEAIRLGQARADDLRDQASATRTAGALGGFSSAVSSFATYSNKFRPASLR